VTGDPREREDAGWIGALIAALPDEQPPPGWQADVRSAIAGEHPAPAAAHRRWTVAALAFAAAAAVLLRGVPVEDSAPADDGAPSIDVVPGDGARRGDGGDAALGDMLRVAAHAGGGELRIYRDDREVVLRCPRAACRHAEGGVIAELRVTAPGVYRAVVLERAPASGDLPAPPLPATGSLEGDVAACGCAAQISVPIVAR
jgi:hypothetical protein